MKCTWKDCKNEALIEQRDRHGKTWSNLCREHHNKLEESIRKIGGKPKLILKNWVLASGGASAMTKRIFHRRRNP